MSRDTCHCGHHKDTHHEKFGTCLGVRCNCPRYRDDAKSDVHDEKPREPPHASWCRCYDCKRWNEWRVRNPS